jgi:hypothetical protein
MIKIFNQEESESGKQENRKRSGFDCCSAFNSLAPAHSVTSGRIWKERRGIRKAGTQEG